MAATAIVHHSQDAYGSLYEGPISPGVPSHPQNGYGSMVVVDPMSKKLSIPFEYLYETRAAQRQGVPSLCMLFLQGRCRQGSHCHQVHADPNLVYKLREHAQKFLLCCVFHGDPSALPQAWSRFHLKIHGGSGSIIPMKRLAYTQGLHRLVDEHLMAQSHRSRSDSDGASNDEGEAGTAAADIITANVQVICRLHGQDRCRFSEDCKFLHLCKEILWPELSLAAPATPPRRFGNGAPTAGFYANGNGAPPPPPMPYDAPPPPFRPSYVGRGIMASNESLGSMDLTPTPPLTPTTPKHHGHGPHAGAPLHQLSPPTPQSPLSPQSPGASVTMVRGQSFSYEPYGWNPFALPPTVCESAQ